MDEKSPQHRVAVLIFAEAQQRDLRRRGLPSRASNLLALPRLDDISASADVHWFCDRPFEPPVERPRDAPLAASQQFIVHRQRGRTFAQRLENAVDDLAQAGYEKIVILGRDCPQLTRDDVTRAIELLDSQRLVIGPDHRGGCWLIALHATDREKLHGVRWRRDTDAAELLSRFGATFTSVLDVKFDLDHAGDLRDLAKVFAPALAVLAFTRCAAPATTLRIHVPLCFVRLSCQIPPPASRFAA